MDNLIPKYCKLFSKLNVSRSHGIAPHKPILLLAVLEAISIKLVTSQKVLITAELIKIFKNYWNAIVESKHTQNFSLPFFHMRTERFWNLIPAPPFSVKQLNSIRSLKSLKSLEQLVAYAEIDKELFMLASNHEDNLKLKTFIIQHYFGITLEQLPTYSINDLFNSYENQLLVEDESDYKKVILSLEELLSKDELEEELKVRSGAFRKFVSKEYNETCAISNLSISSIDSYSAIDACHIIPFHLSKSDHITNGISMCPNLHRAFDRGIISIGDNYELLIKNSFVESNSVYGIRQFEGKKINLPINKKYYPSLENLKWHRNAFGF